MLTDEEREILWRAIDEHRRACGTSFVVMARRSVERAVEDICMRQLDAVMNEISRTESGATNK